MQAFYVTRLVTINSEIKMYSFMWFLEQVTSTGSKNEEAPPTDPISNRRKTSVEAVAATSTGIVTSPGRGTCSWSSNAGTRRTWRAEPRAHSVRVERRNGRMRMWWSSWLPTSIRWTQWGAWAKTRLQWKMEESIRVIRICWFHLCQDDR